MDESARVTVYSFLHLDRHVESPGMAPYKATLTAIESLQGKWLPGTGETVPLSSLDAHGRYVRRTSKWGELN